MRANIWVPDLLATELRVLKGKVNVSQVCQTALEAAVEEHRPELTKRKKEVAALLFEIEAQTADVNNRRALARQAKIAGQKAKDLASVGTVVKKATKAPTKKAPVKRAAAKKVAAA